jgi:hypothetical protein
MSTINLDSARFIIWGYRNRENYHTHSHIHEGFYRAAKYMRPGSLWLDQSSKIIPQAFDNSIIITEHDAARTLLPFSEDCFYVVHGMSDDAACRERISSWSKNHLSWNVYHDFSHVYGTQGNPACHGITTMQFPLTDKIWLGEDCPFYPKEQHMDFRWATDLLPHEIQRNKPWNSWNSASSVINWVGTFWHVNEKEIAAFRKACEENDIAFRHYGAGQEGVMSIEDNVRLVRESRFAPAIVGSHHITEGYAPCRIFKNISYGQMGITNSKRVNDIFGGKLIFHPDPYKLYYHAIEQLQTLAPERVWELMDEVGTKHTYLNRLQNILTAAKHIVEN